MDGKIKFTLLLTFITFMLPTDDRNCRSLKKIAVFFLEAYFNFFLNFVNILFCLWIVEQKRMDIINARINNQDDVLRKGQLNPLQWVCRRERTGQLYGSQLKHSSCSYSRAKFFKGLYNSFDDSGTWNNPSGNPYQYGAIFNFDFTPDG